MNPKSLHVLAERTLLAANPHRFDRARLGAFNSPSPAKVVEVDGVVDTRLYAALCLKGCLKAKREACREKKIPALSGYSERETLRPFDMQVDPVRRTLGKTELLLLAAFFLRRFAHYPSPESWERRSAGEKPLPRRCGAAADE